MLCILLFNVCCYYLVFRLGMAMRMREYVVRADHKHMRAYADVDENLIHINHKCINICQKL